MELTIDTSGPFTVARINGGLGVDDEAELIERLQPLVADRRAKLAIVLSTVTSINSSGLSALIGLVTRARMCEGRVILVAPTPFVRGVMEVTQLDEWFEICDDLDEAARRFA
jgi:anti-anti-sigma factor